MGDLLQDMAFRIKKKRIELKLSQEQLAVKTGYKDRTSIAKIESGKVDLSHSKIIEFANALLTTPSYLMGWEEEEEKTEQPAFNTIAAHSNLPLTEKEMEKVLEFAKFIISQRGNEEQ